MNMGTVPLCGFCGRPIALRPMWLGGMAYHAECTQPPRTQPATFQPLPLTANEVRQIVREELERARGVAMREVPVTLEQVEDLAKTMWKGEPVPGRVLRFGAAVLGLADAASGVTPTGTGGIKGMAQ